MMPNEHTDRRDAGGDLEDLPADVRALSRRLADESAVWRAGTPELARVGERLRERAQQLTLLHQQHQQDSQTDTAILPVAAQRRWPRSLPPRATGDIPMPHTLVRRASGWLAATAAIAVVAALAALLVTASRGGPAVGYPSSTTATGGEPAVQHGKWVSLDTLAANVEFDANDLPAIAPSDPRVVYETLALGIQQGQPAALRRTDDGGATWHALPVPVPAAHVGHAGFLVSPLDAHTVFLSLVDTHAQDCPPGTAQPMGESTLPGAVLCWLQYTSADGGAHWAATQLPGPGTLTPNLTNNSETWMPAGRGPDGHPRLYAILNCADTSMCTRLIASADDGRSWQYADVALLADGTRQVCATTADAYGVAVYAVTTVGSDCGWRAQQALTLWRSDDAGAHWTRLGALATPNIRGMMVAHTPAGGAVLYAVEPRTTQLATDKMGGKYPLFSADPADVKVSTDGGASWASAPSAGIAAGLKSYYDIGLLGTLSDGSIVVEMIAQSRDENFEGGTLYAWKPGDAAWRQLAPPLTWEIGSLTTVPAASGAPGRDTLFLVMVNRGGYPQQASLPTYSVLRYDP